MKVNGTDIVAGKAVPAPFIGDRKINNNHEVVDAIRKAHGATATVFVKDGEEFVRISTGVLTPESKRGIGTRLARNKAYKALVKGQPYCGPINALGTAFDACDNPVKNATGAVVAEVRGNAESVATASAQIASGNADNARQADQRAREASAVASQAGAVVRGLQQAVAALNTAGGRSGYRHGLRLDQSLLNQLEAQSRWALREGLVPDGAPPDFLQLMRPRVLAQIDPTRVTLVSPGVG